MRAYACIAHILAVAALSILPVSARADAGAREASRSEFRRGVELLQQGKFEGARDALAEAYRLFPHPSILLDLGIARLKTGEYAQAERDLVRFLADDGGAPAAEIASGREALAEARQHLSTLSIRVEPPGAKAMLDDGPVALAPGTRSEVRTPGGAHTLRVEADGRLSRVIELRLDAGKTRTLDVALEPEPPDAGSFKRRAGYWFLGSAGALSVVGGISGLYALSSAHAYSTRGESGYQDPDVKSSGLAFRTLADASFAVALGCAGAGVALVLLGHQSRPALAASPSGVWLTGGF
jgi:tetratricopeptide (TPR) repeat protein